MNIHWTQDDDERAAREGWGLFETGGEGRGRPRGGRFQLQKDDGADVFRTDGEAWAFVAEGAKEGGELHTRAVAFLAEFSPEEYREVLKTA